MIMYSIIPSDIIFSNETSCEAGSRYKEIDYMGEKVQVMSATNGEYVITRILSTSLKAYLNPGLQPGSTVKI